MELNNASNNGLPSGARPSRAVLVQSLSVQQHIYQQDHTARMCCHSAILSAKVPEDQPHNEQVGDPLRYQVCVESSVFSTPYLYSVLVFTFV